MKNWIKYIFFGILMGCTVLVIMGMIVALFQGETFQTSSSEFIKMGIGSMIIGVGFSVPSMIYANEKMAYVLKVLIHLGIGLLIYLGVSIWLGWIPLDLGVGGIVTYIFIAIAIAVLIWSGFFLYYRHEAKKINEKIKALKKD